MSRGRGHKANPPVGAYIATWMPLPRCVDCGGDVTYVGSFDRDEHWRHLPVRKPKQ